MAQIGNCDKKMPIRVDFISEFHYRNCQHIIDNILEHLCPMTIFKASKVCQTWKIILKQSSKFALGALQVRYVKLSVQNFTTR